MKYVVIISTEMWTTTWFEPNYIFWINFNNLLLDYNRDIVFLKIETWTAWFQPCCVCFLRKLRTGLFVLKSDVFFIELISNGITFY